MRRGLWLTEGNKCKMRKGNEEEMFEELRVVVEFESRDYECDPPEVPTLNEMVKWKNWDEWRFEDEINGRDDYPWKLAHRTLKNVTCDGWPYEVEDLPVPVVDALLNKYRDILLKLSFDPIS